MGSKGVIGKVERLPEHVPLSVEVILFHQGKDMIVQEDGPLVSIGWLNNISSSS